MALLSIKFVDTSAAMRPAENCNRLQVTYLGPLRSLSTSSESMLTPLLVDGTGHARVVLLAILSMIQIGALDFMCLFAVFLAI
jgi:hypothetical protein